METSELIKKIKQCEPHWDAQTKEIFDYLWSAWESAELDLGVYKARVEKVWPTKGSNLYTEDELQQAVYDSYYEASCNFAE
jgi:hypothetical protein